MSKHPENFMEDLVERSREETVAAIREYLALLRQTLGARQRVEESFGQELPSPAPDEVVRVLGGLVADYPEVHEEVDNFLEEFPEFSEPALH